MGYTTTFEGRMEIRRPLTPNMIRYINKLARTRRMRRNSNRAEKLPDPIRQALKMPIGVDGGYFVGGEGGSGQDADSSVLDYNQPPDGQPSLWCKWEVTEDGSSLRWNGAEKFYNYVEWLRYLIKHFFEPWGRTLNGAIRWQGEELGDLGVIVCQDNVVTSRPWDGARDIGASVLADYWVTAPGTIGRQFDTNVKAQSGFDEFLQDATSYLRETWEARNGGELGEIETQELSKTLKAWFSDKRNG